MSNTVDVVPAPESELHRDFTSQKRFSLLGLIVLAAVLGGTLVFITEGTSSDKLVTIVGALLALSFVFSWLHYDSLEQRYRIGPLLRICIILIAGIGIPIYFFRTRGLRGFLSIGLTLLFACGLVLIAYASGYAVEYIWMTFAQ